MRESQLRVRGTCRYLQRQEVVTRNLSGYSGCLRTLGYSIVFGIKYTHFILHFDLSQLYHTILYLPSLTADSKTLFDEHSWCLLKGIGNILAGKLLSYAS